jgi:hypothetical protein
LILSMLSSPTWMTRCTSSTMMPRFDPPAASGIRMMFLRVFPAFLFLFCHADAFGGQKCSLSGLNGIQFHTGEK